MKSYLSEYKKSGKFVVHSICKKSGFYSKLVGQGLYRGKEFEIISFTQGKYVLKVDNSKITIDESMACHIVVKECGKTCLWSRIAKKIRKNKKYNFSYIDETLDNDNHEAVIVGEKLKIQIKEEKKIII